MVIKEVILELSTESFLVENTHTSEAEHEMIRVAERVGFHTAQLWDLPWRLVEDTSKSRWTMYTGTCGLGLVPLLFLSGIIFLLCFLVTMKWAAFPTMPFAMMSQSWS